ncbi:hypothetical protein FBU30_008005 [Linnemannia zychae]|nr:hypothetical protein FBU30_008005 [Linnemannia zychae]
MSTMSPPLQEHIVERTNRFIQFLESVNYPHEFSPEDIYAQLADQYALTTAPNVTSLNSESSPGMQFLDWLLDNVTVESNWLGYDSRIQEPIDLDRTGRELDEEEGEIALASLDQHCSQLQNTLASLEKELENLQILESQAIDTNRLLDMDIHDTSVKLDAMAAKLESTAQNVSSGYLGRTQETRPNTSNIFIYQCEDDLEYIKQLDKAYVETTKLLYDQILRSIYSLSTTNTAPTHSLSQLMKRNPQNDQEIVRLCSTYRATKMSHIRAVAQLKCLEEELRYMKSLENITQEKIQAEEAADNENKTGDYSLYTIASSKNLLIQKSRQQEMELISVQRETARLKDEMEQLLSDPEQTRIIEQTFRNHEGVEGSGYDEDEDMARSGMLVDLCERIARCDIELPFLMAVHEDFMREHSQALKELDQIVDRLLEYYCLGAVVEQTLEREKKAIQSQKDLLWAAVSECQDLQIQSRQLHGINQHYQDQSQSSPGVDANPVAVQRSDADEIAQLLKRNIELRRDGNEERQKLQEHVQELANANDILNNQIIRQHSSTNQVQFVPRVVHDLKEDISRRVCHIQQEYIDLKNTIPKTPLNPNYP